MFLFKQKTAYVNRVSGWSSDVCSSDLKKPSYLASIDWQATPDILLYAKTSSSFRGGGCNVRGGSSGGDNPYNAFDPETATDYEIGFKGDLFDRKVRLNLAGYYTDYSDIQKSSLIVVNNKIGRAHV